jgi:hypothetical protein
MCCVVPEFGRSKEWKKKKNTNCKNSQRTKGIKVIEEERTAGTLKLTAIASRRMRARAGDLKLTMEGDLMG